MPSTARLLFLFSLVLLLFLDSCMSRNGHLGVRGEDNKARQESTPKEQLSAPPLALVSSIPKPSPTKALQPVTQPSASTTNPPQLKLPVGFVPSKESKAPVKGKENTARDFLAYISATLLPGPSSDQRSNTTVPFATGQKASLFSHKSSRHTTKSKTKQITNSNWSPSSSLIGASSSVDSVPSPSIPKEAAPLSVTALGGEHVSFVEQGGQWYAEVTRQLAAGSVPVRRLPVRSKQEVGKALSTLSGHSPSFQKRRVRVIQSSQGEDFVLVGSMGLKGGSDGESDDEDNTGNTGRGAPMPPVQLRMRKFSLPSAKERIAKGDINATEELIAALNDPGQEDKTSIERWLQQYINWFDDQRTVRLGEGDLEELALLSEIKPNSNTNKRLLRNYLKLLCNKTRQQAYRDEDLIQLLNYNLQHIDPAVFEGNPKVLIDLAQDLLEKLDPEKRKQQFSQSTYLSYEQMLSALHQSLVLIQQIDPASWDPQKKDSLYGQFKARLEAVKGEAAYYPFVYQSELTLQGLSRLGKSLSKTRERLRKLFYGVKGGYHLYKGVRSLISLDPNGEAFVNGYSSFKEAMKGRAVKAAEWYSCLQAMGEAASLALADPARYSAFEEGLEALAALNIKHKRTRKALHYGVVKQLGALALHSADEKVRLNSQKWLGILSENKLWNTDKEVKEALLSASKPSPAPIQPSGRVFREVVQSINEEAALAQAHGTVIVPMRVGHHDTQLQGHYKSSYGVLSTFLGNGGKQIPIEAAQSSLAYHEEQEEKAQGKDKEEGTEAKKDQIADHHHRQQRTKKAIVLGELFQDRVIKGQNQSVRKVLLVGEAGKGKTTIGKKLAYEWSLGQNPEWEAVYLLPVRALQKGKYDQRQGPLLATAIALECFPKMKDEASFQALVKRIAEQLKSDKTLVMLDGLDERTSSSEAVLAAAQTGVHKLLMTSRPYGIEDFQQQADFAVEVQILKKDQVASYVKRYLGAEESEKLLEFLSKHPVLHQLAKVPVTLNILCALWHKEGKNFQKVVGGSPTGLYRELTRHIWKHYKAKHKGKKPTNKKRNELFQTLGQVSLSGMKKGEALLSPKTVEDVLDDVEEEEEMQAFMQESGLLEAVGGSHTFPHLTFQEYFAGKELSRMLLDGSKKEKQRAVKFLKAHKYEAHYVVVLTFMAGEVYEKEGLAGVQKLLRTLNEDKELVGLQHSLLQLRCLNEWLSMDEFDASDLEELEGEFVLMKGFEDWIQRGLKDEDIHEVLLDAFPFLGSVLRTGEAARIYVGVLGDKDSSIRCKAAKVLGDIAASNPLEGHAMVQPLIKALKGKDSSVHQAAAAALGKIAASSLKEAPAIVQHLVGALGNQDKDVCFAAVVALGYIAKSNPEEVPTIVSHLVTALENQNEDKYVRFKAAAALGKIAKSNPEEASAIVQCLVKALENQHVRWAAAEALGYIAKSNPLEGPAMVHPLVKALGSENKDVRRAAAKALGYIAASNPLEGPAMVQPLVKALGDKDGYVRRTAAEALGYIAKSNPEEGPVMVQPLVKALGSENKDVRRAVAKALGYIAKSNPDKVSAILEPFVTALGDKDGNIQEKAAEALGYGDSIMQRLVTALEDKEYAVRWRAVEDLGYIAKFNLLKASTIVQHLVTALKDKEYAVRWRAAEVLGYIAQSNPLKAPAIIQPLVTALGDKDEDVRRAAAEALGYIAKSNPLEGHAMVQPLVKALGSENKDVRRAVAKALGYIAKSNPLEGHAMVQPLVKALGSENKDVRRAVAKALGYIAASNPAEAPDIVKHLVTALGDKEWNVRSTAEKVLKACPTKQLIDSYMANPASKNIVPIMKEKLYQEPLVIRPSKKRGHKELVLYSNNGKPIKWQVTDAEAQRLQQLF